MAHPCQMRLIPHEKILLILESAAQQVNDPDEDDGT